LSLRVAVVTSGFPRRSETFALNELRALDEAGVLAALFATKPGDGLTPHPGAADLLARVELLPPVAPVDQARVVAARLRGLRVDGIHGYFAHEPAEVAAAAGEALEVRHGFSVHARDARKVAPAALAARAATAACVIACNPDVAGEVPAADGRLRVIPHGVDLDRFRPSAASANGGELRLLAVGRLVEKKGFDVLLEAAARLQVPFRLRLVGEGPDRERLAGAVRTAGLEDRVELVGERTHVELPVEYAAADIVVVPSIADSSGDRDGLPNVVLEAMASGRPVVASGVGAIATGVEHGDTGILVPPGDREALAAAIAELAHSPERRDRLGRAGRARVEHEFALAACTERLRQTLEAAYA
jgi:glycosyltransferase involved in cell wall biosynthesis